MTGDEEEISSLIGSIIESEHMSSCYVSSIMKCRLPLARVIARNIVSNSPTSLLQRSY
jgi:hypothetical protein